MTNLILFKVLRTGGVSIYADYQYSLPTGDGPGDWMPRVEINPCYSGYHLCRGAAHLLHWLGPEIYGVETRGELINADDKVVASEVRLIARVKTWTAKSMCLFNADCAEHVLPIFEREYPKDGRPRAVIAAARAFAKGKIDDAALSDAADAAMLAAESAAESAAKSAAWSATGYAARSAARSAAWSAAGFGARSVAWSAAGYAARSAAWYAAAPDAWSAAEDAERQWQVDQLRAYLRGDA